MKIGRRRAFAAGAAALALVAVAAAYRFRPAPDRGAVRVSGNIEATDVDLSFRLPGRVAERLVGEGMAVSRGQIVARLESRDLEHEVALRDAELAAAAAALAELEAGTRPQEIARAEAEVAQASARLQELTAGSRPQEIEAARAALARAKAEAERLARDFERMQVLLRHDAVARRDYEAARAAHEVAQARVREAEEGLRLVEEGPRKEQIAQARAALARSEETLALAKEGPRKERIAQARARVRQAQEAAALARTRLSFATLVSPIEGVVLSENVEAGDYVAPGTPVVTVGALRDVWLRAYIAESDLGRVKLGQSVVVTTDSCPGKRYEGRVSFIAPQAEFTPKSVQTAKERVKLVYRIKVDIANPQMELKPGMPADGTILAR